MSATVAIVVVIVLVVVGIGGYLGWKQWIRYKSNKALLDWAGANMEYGQLEEGVVRQTSETSALLADIVLAEFVNRPHGFRLSYPKDWSVNAAKTFEAPIVVQFACPRSEKVYKTLTVTWEDSSWSGVTAEEHGLSLVKSLPTVVPGSVVVSQRVLVPSGDYEVIYDVPGSGKLAALRKITQITTAFNQVFTIVFCAEQLGFDSCIDVAKLMLSSFQTYEPENLRRLSSVSESGVGSPSVASTPPDRATVTVKFTSRAEPQPRQAARDDVMAKQVSQVTVRSEAKDDVSASSSVRTSDSASKRTETPVDVTAIQWKQDSNHPSGIRFSVPSKWSRLPSNKSARNPAVEYVCGRHETAFKSFKLLTVDLSAATISVSEAIQEFTEHYRQQILRQSQAQGTSGITDERRMTSPLAGPSTPSQDAAATLFRVTSEVDGADRMTAAIVSVFRQPSTGALLGYIAAFTTTPAVFKSYEPLAREIFRSLVIDR